MDLARCMFCPPGAREAFLHPGDPFVPVGRDAQRSPLPLDRDDGRGRGPHQGHKHHRGRRKPGRERTGIRGHSHMMSALRGRGFLQMSCTDRLREMRTSVREGVRKSQHFADVLNSPERSAVIIDALRSSAGAEIHFSVISSQSIGKDVVMLQKLK